MKLNLGDRKIYGSMDTVVFVTETLTYINVVVGIILSRFKFYFPLLQEYSLSYINANYAQKQRKVKQGTKNLIEQQLKHALLTSNIKVVFFKFLLFLVSVRCHLVVAFSLALLVSSTVFS